MSVVYMGKYHLCGGFRLRDMWEYVSSVKLSDTAPLYAPAYASEADAERIERLSQKLAEAPCDRRSVYNKSILNLEAETGTVRPVSYAEFPRLYTACEFAAKALCEGTSQPVILTYRAKAGNAGDIYGACAICYLDSARLYFSEQLFRESRMLEDAELCFLAGHELGHARCYHSTASFILDSYIGSDKEYSADRAGLLAATLWLMREKPNESVCDNIKAALLYSAAALEKLTSASAMRKGGRTGLCDWRTFDYRALDEYLEEAQRNAYHLGSDHSTHPTTERRYLAMKLFSESEKFYRCLGLEPDGRAGLFTDTHLREQMYFLLKGGE